MLSHPFMALAKSSLVALLAVGLVAGAASAARPGGGGGGKSCVRNAPTVKVDNNWAWGQSGSWGLAGQQLSYAIDVINRDAGCSASTFVATLTAPGGFAVSFPTSSISLKSASSGYLWATVTSPAGAGDGDYPLAVTLTRSGGSGASATSYYKVYSSDTGLPTLFWPAPGDGTTITGSSFGFAVSANDDHAVKTIDLSIDGVQRATTVCDNVTYTCQFRYTASLAGLTGQHSATFTARDWLGNPNAITVSFTVN